MQAPRRSRVPLRIAAATMVAWVLWAGVAPASGQSTKGTILLAKVEAIVTPVLADHLGDAIAEAAEGGYDALVVELDTPGGLDSSMREIVKDFLSAEVPVVVYVGPAGARAASAGAIITMAAHVAAMAPGTAIGAATPVDLQGGDISDKIINDFAAYARSIADLRGRNPTFAEDAVRKGRSVPADEAAAIGVVDLIADDIDALLEALDGRRVKLANGSEVTLNTADAPIDRFELRGFRSFLQWLADPNIAFMFMSIGTLGILYELSNPGMGGAGIVGVILIILALFSLSVLPVSAVGGLLILLAAGLFIAEVFAPGIGVFAAGGTVALILGGVFLFRGSLEVDLSFLLPVALTAGGTALVIGRFAWRTRNLRSRSGMELLIGNSAVIRTIEGGDARVFLEGAWWTARADRPLAVGQQVKVVGMDNLVLVVEPEEQGEDA